ncbi:MAG: hypothetical protein R3222_04480 [Balneolaceae bacterium]|nr:hypothetical protein [Balneolaceae bacterium]
MKSYNTVLDEIEADFKKESEKKMFWKNTRQNEDCSDLTVAQDLSVSIMTIFEIESIEMKEGFIY